MPTAEVDSRTHNRLPDIFRTINGINLDIGPFDRLRDSVAPDESVPWGRGEKGVTGRSNFPRIVLRDALGRELDTLTTLQEAIYRAKWNVKQSGHPKNPLEWRLPKAPAPARPDLTRTFPPVKHPPAHPPDGKLKGRFDSSRALEFDVEDVGFVRESLQYLPYAPSLSFLRQEILVGPKTYFQIVGTLLLHKRILSQTEKRNAIYNFPGFCSGCMRMGLCYGCERSTEVHFHEDKPVKTGGGFTYFKKDRPENEIKSRNPINWKIQHPDKALKKLMEEYAGVELEGPVSEEIKKHLDKHGGHSERVVSHIPDFAREMKAMNDKEKVLKGDGHLPDIHVRYGVDDEIEDDLVSESEGHHGRRGHDLDLNDVKVYIEGQGEEDEGDGYQGQQRYRDGRGMEQPSHLSGSKSDAKSRSGMLDDKLKSGYITSDDESYRDGSHDRHGLRLPRYRRNAESGSDEENDEREQSDDESGSRRQSRRKEKLYKAPAPFKLKKSPKRSIMSKSPFSTDREYDLPKGKAFEVKKSDKQTTKFKEFRNVDASWKEPKKFELKKNDQKATKFWSGPPKKKEKEKEREREKRRGDRSHGLKQVPSPRSVSPDSGLDSENLTAIRRQLPAKKSKTTVTDTVFKREPEEENTMSDEHILVPTDRNVFNSSQNITADSYATGTSLAKMKKTPRKKMDKTKFQLEIDDMAASTHENSEVQKPGEDEFRTSVKVPNKEPLSEDAHDQSPRVTEAENDMVISSDVTADLNEDTDDESDHLRQHQHGRKRKLSLRHGKKKKDKRSSGELPLGESDNQSDEHSNKLANQSSRYRSKSQHVKATGTNQVSSESQSDDVSYYSTNQSSLDGFHDTATEYYKNFDLEAFQRKQNLREQLRKSPRKLSSLTHRTEAHFSVSILKTLKDVKSETRRFSNQGGLSSRPSLKSSNFFPQFPDSEKLGESKTNGRERSRDTLTPGLDDKQGLRQTGSKVKGSSSDQQKCIVYQPRSSAISPILYRGDKSDTYIEHSDADENWNEVSDEVKRLCKGHMTLSDLESETSVQQRKHGGSDTKMTMKIGVGQRHFIIGGDTHLDEEENVNTKDARQLALDVDGQRKYKTTSINGKHGRNENLPSGEKENFSVTTVVKTEEENNISMNRDQSNSSLLSPKKISKGQSPSGIPCTKSESNSPGMFAYDNEIQSNRKSSRSMIKEYQKFYQQQHLNKSGSLPAVGMDIKSDRSEDQRSLSVGHFTPYFGSPDLYDKHARGSSNKSRTSSLSRRPKTAAKFSRSDSISEDLEDIWIKDGLNRRKQVTLKVPTGRRESFLSSAQSQFTGSFVDLKFGTDVLADEEKAEDVKKSETDTNNLRRSSTNMLKEFEHSGSSSDAQSGSHYATFSPPLIPSDVDQEKGSLTSQEPDLELAFDYVVDVENLEVLEDENYQNEETAKQKKLERRRRHKHRKHRKRKKDQLNTLGNDFEENASGSNTLEGTTDLQKSVNFDDTTEYVDDENEERDNINKTSEIQKDSNDLGYELSEEDFVYDAVNEVARENLQNVQASIVDDKTRKRRRHKKKKDANDHTNLSERDASFEKLWEKQSKHRKPWQTKSKRNTHVHSKYGTDESISEDDTHREFDDVEGNEARHNESRRKQAFLEDENKFEDEKNKGNDVEELIIAHSDNKRSRKDRKMTKKKQNESQYGKAVDINEGKQTHDKQEFDQLKENERNKTDGKRENGGRNKRSKDRKRQRKIEFYNSIQDGFSQAIHKGRKKLIAEKREQLSDEEVDFDKLPSIKSQLAKIFEMQTSKIENKYEDIDEFNEVKNSLPETEKEDNIDLIKSTGSENKMEKHLLEHKRPNSADKNNFLGDSGMNMKMFRSMSLPVLSDIETLQQNMGDITLEQLMAPLRVPVYLPAFPQGNVFVKKQFKANPKRVKGREKRSMSISIVTLTPQLFDLEDTTNKSELEPVREETRTVTPDMGLSEGAGTPLQLRVQSPVTDKPPRSVSPPPPPKKREIIKKVKKPRSPVRSPEPPPRPPTPAKEETPSPVPVEERPVSRETSFDYVKEKFKPELPPIEIPELPEIQERQSEYKGIKKEKKLIEVTPEIPDPKKKLPPPPKLGPRIKTRTTRKSKVAEAPVTTQELEQLSDPLDFLAKYCIINPDRLPYYERVFNSAVNIQTPRYTRDSMATQGGMVHLPPAELSEHELNMLRDLTVISHAQSPRKEGVSMPEQYLEKLNYTIEFIKSKQEKIVHHMHELQGEKVRLMAQMAKELDRDIVRVDYKTKGSKKKKKEDEDANILKKKKKKKTDEPDYDTMGAMSVPKNFRPQRASDITDEVIVSRMDDKMMKKVKKDPTVKNYNMQINRDLEKLKHFDQRIAQIEDERDLVGLYCMDYYFNEQNGSAPPYAFRRQQSRLYQKLHPDPDIEMNIDEVETALQQINNKLLSEKEFQYIYFILDLPKREKINFRLFSIVAALSEKVTQMDPVIRKLINKVDYNALDIKMDKSKELFELIQDENLMPVGNAPAETLAVELTAGGLTPEHTSYVLSKFNREGRGFIDFLDFVTYIPLFIEIHKRIIQDPFNETLDV